MSLLSSPGPTRPLSRPFPRPLAIAFYALTLLLAGWYGLVLWWAAHPVVSADYRAYYIDQTTTCMNQPVSGAYRFGTIVSFQPPGRDDAKPLKVCGWEGPVGDGTHALGTSARLRFAPEERPADMVLVLTVIAVKKDTQPTQQVEVIIDDKVLGSIEAVPEEPRRYRIPLPAELAARPGPIELRLEFPDAVKMGPTDAPTRYRSIKLIEAGLVPA